MFFSKEIRVFRAGGESRMKNTKGMGQKWIKGYRYEEIKSKFCKSLSISLYIS